MRTYLALDHLRICIIWSLAAAVVNALLGACVILAFLLLPQSCLKNFYKKLIYENESMINA